MAPVNNRQESEKRSLCSQIQISIVDDDRFVREALARLIKSHGYLAETFESAAALLGSDWRAHTDCLIVDMQMPEMTGLELHGQLVAAGEEIPTILITAHPDESSRARALSAGVLCYLAKPFSEDDLLSCVRRAVTR
jgi:FixJ family two-component response regulator